MFNRLMLASALSLLPTLLLAEGGYVQTNLVANRQIFGAAIIDKHMLNAWGLAIRPAGAGGHFWINNTDSGTVSLYVGDVKGKPLFQDDIRLVTLPAPKAGEKSTPTGQVFNGRDDEFIVTHDGITGPSKFIFCTEDGTILGWTEQKKGDGTFARPANGVITVDNGKRGAIYKGIAVSNHKDKPNHLYAADFARGRIDVFDAGFKAVTLAKDAFQRPEGIPKNYAPFNIQEIDGSLFIAYAKLTKTKGEEEKGEGFGHVAQFDFDGKLIKLFKGGGLLNAPWAFARAPEKFGPYSERLLVGNFGDGTIVAFDPNSGEQLGVLKTPSGDAVEIDGLWGLIFGNGESLGERNALYFAAGPNDEKDGVFGRLNFVE